MDAKETLADVQRRLTLGANAAAELKYGEVAVGGKQLHPGEVLFLFRGTDNLAPAAIRDYAMRCRVSGCADAHVNGVFDAADRMAAWQAANPDLVKLPD